MFIILLGGGARSEKVGSGKLWKSHTIGAFMHFSNLHKCSFFCFCQVVVPETFKAIIVMQATEIDQLVVRGLQESSLLEKVVI